MSLTTEDIKYLDGKFGEVHSRLSTMRSDVDTNASDLKHHTDRETICPKALAAVKAHVTERHNMVKTMAIIVGVFTVLGILYEFVSSLLPFLHH